MTAPSCPFPGLLPFQEKDAPFFFGRERETAELLQRLECNRFVAVIGVSGSGKSSLVHAGLKPELRLASPPCRIVELKPGGGPRRRLQSALESVVPGPAWRELLGKSSYGLVDGIARAGLGGGDKVLVVVDQFEEIFSYRKLGHAEAEEADLFVQQLLRGSTEPAAPVRVMLTMRTDYLGHCALFRNLAEALNEGTYLVPRLTRHEQEDAIRSPLAVSGVEIEPAVVDLLLNAAEANRDELPVLQHLLKRLWEEWAARGAAGKITRADYVETGEWDRAITLDAESVFDRMSADEQTAARLVFQRITEKGTGERPVRAPCPLAKLIDLTAPLLPAARLREVLTAFRARDLLVWVDEEQPGRERIDIPHECVTWRWQRLSDWIDEEDRDARRLAFVAESARAGTPLAGSALEESRALRGRIADPWVGRYQLSAGELTRWIDLSEREAARARRRTRNAVAALAVAALLFAALGLWAWQQKSRAERESKLAQEAKVLAERSAIQAKDAENLTSDALKEVQTKTQSLVLARASAVEATKRAQERADEALARAREGRARLAALLAEHSRNAGATDPERALLLALEAGYATTRQGEPQVAEAERALRGALANAGGRLLRLPDMHVGALVDDDARGMAVSPDQRWLAVVNSFTEQNSWKTKVRLARLDSQSLQSEVLGGARHPIVFTPDSRWLVTAAVDGGLLLWDVTGVKRVANPLRLGSLKQGVESLTVSADGRWLAAGPPTQVWDLAAGKMPPEGIAIADCASEANPIGVSRGQSYMFISPDSRWLISGGSYRVTRMAPPPWNPCLTDLRAASPAASTRALRGHDRSVTHVAFSENGRWMATFSREGGSRGYVKDDRSVRIWDLAASDPSAEPAAVLPALDADVRASALLAPDGQWLLGQSGSLWDLSRDVGAKPVEGLQGTPVALGPPRSDRSRWAVTVLRDVGNTAVLWKMKPESAEASGWSLERQPDPLGRALRIAVTRNQQWVAIGGRDGTVQLWDLASEDPRRTPRRFAGSGDVKRVEFDDVGRSLSVASDHAVRVWSLSQLHGAADPIVLSTPRGVLRQDRWLVAAADDDRYINRWDLHDPAPSVPTVIADGPGVEPAALSRDGRWLASWDREQRLRLWRLESRDQPALLWSPAMVKAPKGYRSRPPVAFSADGRWLAAGFFDGSVQLRNLPSYRTTTVQGHDSDVVRVAFTDDGRWLLTADNKGRGCLWRVAVEKMGPPQCEGGVQDLQVGGGGRWLFATTRRSIRLWSLAFDQPWARPLVLESGFKDVSNVLIDPDGRWVIASGDSLVLWRRHPQGFSDGQTLTKLYDPLIRLSPDGRWLAAVGPSREPVLWDLLAPRAPQSIPRARSPDFGDTLSFYGPRPGSAALAVLRDASGSNQIIGFVDPSSLAANRARAWIDLPEGARVSHTRLAGFLTPGHYHVSGDGRWLVSIEQSTTSLQRLRAQELERLACEIADRNLTDEEWARYFPDQKHRATCPQLAAVKPKS